MKLSKEIVGMTFKERYREICKTQEDVPLFMQPYWLDLVCDPDTWDVTLSFDEDGAISGAWAYHTGSRYGLRYVRLPALTPFTGIWMHIPQDLPVQKQMARRHEIISDLETQLPAVPILELKLHWSLQDWLPLYWKGYRQETRYTFYFPEPHLDTILENTSKSFRRNLRTAQRRYVIEEGNAHDLHRMMEHVLALRDARSPVTEEMLGRIVGKMRERGQCKVYSARDGDMVNAIIFTVWDAHTTYYLIGGRADTNNRHAAQMLLCEAIRDAEQRGHAFDFEGSMIQGVNVFFQSFGAQLMPYCFIYRYRGIAKWKYLNK